MQIEFDEQLSNYAFNSNLRRYNEGDRHADDADDARYANDANDTNANDANDADGVTGPEEEDPTEAAAAAEESTLPDDTNKEELEPGAGGLEDAPTTLSTDASPSSPSSLSSPSLSPNPIVSPTPAASTASTGVDVDDADGDAASTASTAAAPEPLRALWPMKCKQRMSLHPQAKLSNAGAYTRPLFSSIWAVFVTESQ